MDIYLIRHTKTDTPAGLCYGQSNVGLAESFTAELATLKQKLPDLTANCQVYSSSLDRCMQLAKAFSTNIRMDDRLLEINFGEWEGVLFDDIPPDSLKYWTENFVHSSQSNGECFNDLYQRVSHFWQELISSDAEQVLIVTHAGVIRALLAHILNIPLANAFAFKVDCGSVHKFQYLNQYTYIQFINL